MSLEEARQKYYTGQITAAEFSAIVGSLQENPLQETEIEEDPGFFDVLNQSFQQLLATGGAGIRVLGETFGSESIANYGDEVVRNREAQAAKYGRPMQIEDIEGVGDAADWLFTSAIPQVIPSILTALPLAITGAAVGAAAIPVAVGTAATRAAIGGGIGAFLPSSFLGAGEIDREMKRRAGDGFEDPLAAIGGGAIIGALDTAALAVGLKGVIPQLIKKTPLGKELLDDAVAELINKGVAPSIAKRAFAQGALASIAEGTTEASQELINDLVSEASTGISSEEGELTSNLINSFALGAVGGAPIGLVSGAVRARTEKDNFLMKQEIEKTEKAAEEDAENFIKDQQLDTLSLSELIDFGRKRYGEGVINFNLNKNKILEDIKAQEKIVNTNKRIEEEQKLFLIEGTDLAGKEELEIKTLEQRVKDLERTPLQILQEAREINPNFNGSFREAVELVAKTNIENAHVKQGKSKKFFNGLALERYRKMLETENKEELAVKASKLSPHLYKDVETAEKATRQELAKEIAFGELAVEQTTKDSTYSESQELVEVPVEQDQTQYEIKENVINIRDAKRGKASEFVFSEEVTDYKGDTHYRDTTFYRVPVKSGKEIITYKYNSSKDGRGADFVDTDRKGFIKSYSITKGKQPRFKEGFFNKALSALSGFFAPGGYGPFKGNIGQAVFMADRKRLSRRRAIDKAAQMLGYEYEEVANSVVIDKKVSSREELDNLVFNYLTKKISITRLPEAIRSTALEMRSLIDNLSTRILNEIPDSVLEQENPGLKKTKREIIESQLGAYLTRSYKIFDPTFGWNPSSIFATKEQKKAFKEAENYVLKNLPEINSRAEATAKVNQIIKTAIKEDRLPTELFLHSSSTPLNNADLKQSPAARFEKERQRVPKELRLLFGEFKNPSEILVQTVNKISSFVENYKFYDQLLEIDNLPGERLFTTAPTKDYDTLVPLKDTPLDNLYTTSAIAEALKLSQEDKSTFYKIYEQFVLIPKGVFQSFKTVFSPMAQMRNYMTASMFYVANGHLNPKDFPDTMRAIGSELSGSGRDTQGRKVGRVRQAEQLYQQMLDLGVVNSNVSLGEILATFDEAASGGYRDLNEFLAFLGAQGGGKVGKFFSFTKKIGRQPAKLYTAADDFWKIASFISEKRSLTKAFDSSKSGTESLNAFAESLDIKTGFLDYERTINEVAAYKVRNTIPNYDYVGFFVRLLRRTPFAPFVAFPTEILRTGYNMYWLAGKEITSGNYEMQVKGYRRLFGAGTMMAGLPTIAVVAGKALSEVDDEEIDAIRRLGPEWLKNSAIIPLGKKETPKGTEYQYMDGSHMFVYDTISSSAFAVFRSIKEGQDIGQGTPEAVANGIASGVYNIVKPYTSLSIAPGLQFELLTGRRIDGGRPITNPEKPWGEQAKDLFNYAFEKGQPGFVQQIGNLINSGTFDEYSFSRYGSKKDFDDAMLSLVGVKINSTNPADSIPFKISEAQRRFSDANRIFTSLSYRSGAVTANDLLNAYKNAQEAYFDIQREGYLDMQAAKKLGVSPSVINKQLNDRINPKDLRRAFRTGIFVPYKPPKSSRVIFNRNTRKMEQQGASISPDRYYPSLEINDLRNFYLRNRLNLLLDFYLPKDED